MEWSPKQAAALQAVAKWFKDKKGPQVFRLFGFAGTGKTTLAKQIAQDLDCRALFGAFTGKAALVLDSKGCTGATTLHSLCYKVRQNEDTGEVTYELNRDSDITTAGLLIVDEVSMVGPDLGNDVLSFGVKVLVLGDPFQLPPVSGEGFFTACQPDMLLDEIHRQAADNPIIRMSMDVREGRGLTLGTYGDSIVRARAAIPREQLAAASLRADQVLVGKNRTRNTLNARMRELKGFGGALPNAGERLVCLRNNRTKGLLNGSLWTVGSASGQPNAIDLTVTSLDDPNNKIPVSTTTRTEFFGGDPKKLDWRERKRFDEFDYGYALTCHKAQGSQWPEVLIFDESSTFRDDADRWLYTAVTRAAERVRVVV